MLEPKELIFLYTLALALYQIPYKKMGVFALVGTTYAYILMLMGNTSRREPEVEPERKSTIEQTSILFFKEIYYEIGNFVSSCYA
jgi:hypothetical protein